MRLSSSFLHFDLIEYGHYSLIIINMSYLDQKDLELIERIVYKNNDDVAVSIARSFERLEERVDSSEARLHSRLSEIEDRMHAF